MPGMTKKLQATFRQAEEMIQNGQANAEVAAAMEAYGYDAGRWAEGQALLETAKEKLDGNQNAFAAQLGATDSFNRAFEEAWDQAQDLAHLCAAIFEGQTETLARLGLHKRRDASTGESEIAWPSRHQSLLVFLPWARNLYSVAQEGDVATALADFGYPAARLGEEAAEVEAVAEADGAQEIAKAEAQQSTVERDGAVEALQAWVNKAKTVSKLALKDKRQLLELMGMRAQRR